MEPFTSGLVSADARKAWLADHREDHWPGAFTAIRRGGLYGYRMVAWQSQITYCRAYGRGVRRGLGKSVHPWDATRPEPVHREYCPRCGREMAYRNGGFYCLACG